MSQWAGIVPIDPATHVFGPTLMGSQQSATMESVPSNGVDYPRPNEVWSLTNVYCPVAIATGAGAGGVAATTAAVILSLVHAGIPVWTSAQEIVLTPSPASTSDSSGNGVISLDFVNPVQFHSGESGFGLSMQIVLNQTVDGLFGYVANQIGLIDASGNATVTPTPGAVRYQAVSIDEWQTATR